MINLKNISKIICVAVLLFCLFGCANHNPQNTINKLENDGFQINLMDQLEPPRVTVMKNRNDPCIEFCFKNGTLEYIQYAKESKGLPELQYAISYNEKKVVNEEAKKAYIEFLTENGYNQSQMEEFAEYIFNEEFENH